MAALWIYEPEFEKDGTFKKWSKVPKRRSGSNASSTDPKSWCTFVDAVATFLKDDRFDGISRVFSKADGISGVDLDHCRDPSTGKIDPWAQIYIDRLESYSEVSPSGEGVHIYVRGVLPVGVDGRKKNLMGEGYRPGAAIEIYSAGHFLTLTGEHVAGTPGDVEDHQVELTAIYEEIFHKVEVGISTISGQGKSSCLADEQVMARMLASVKADVIRRLMDGDTSAYGGDDSAADLGLCNHLAFWCGKNRAQMDRIFRGSKLMRPKWDEMRGNQTYGNITLDEACRGTTEVYEPCDHAHKNISLLEQALLCIDSRCDSATTMDGQGFSKTDAVFGKEMAGRVRAGQRLTSQEYKDIYAMLKKYNRQLVENEMDIRLIPKEPPQVPIESLCEEEVHPVSPDVKDAAIEILKHGDPVKSHLDHVASKVHGGIEASRAVLYSAYSAFMPDKDKLHGHMIGNSQGGKSKTVTTTLETMPPENVYALSEVSPKSLYYMAEGLPEERLKNLIIYIDDAREEHIPVLKTFRNDSEVTPRNCTTVDGEFLELTIQYRPVVMASSVTAPRDLEQQLGSRTFLITVQDASEDEEKLVRATIRQRAEIAALMTEQEDHGLEILHEVARTLRDEGIKAVVIPFDVVEPSSADRRGTGQFMRLIKISAFIHQYQRPILEFKDGRKFVLATYRDLKNAAEVWFDFEAGQEFKTSIRVLQLLEHLDERSTATDLP